MSISISNDADEKDVKADDLPVPNNRLPGEILKANREKLGHSIDYVAAKLHLRVRVIELIESDDYNQMPEPVFIKGYLRAYANLLDLNPEPLLKQYRSNQPEPTHNPDRLLWQSTKPTHHSEKWIRIGTGIFAIVVISAIFFWWQKNKEAESYFSKHVRAIEQKQTSDINLTDLSNMRSLLSSNPDLSSLELKNE